IIYAIAQAIPGQVRNAIDRIAALDCEPVTAIGQRCRICGDYQVSIMSRSVVSDRIDRDCLVGGRVQEDIAAWIGYRVRAGRSVVLDWLTELHVDLPNTLIRRLARKRIKHYYRWCRPIHRESEDGIGTAIRWITRQILQAHRCVAATDNDLIFAIGQRRQSRSDGKYSLVGRGIVAHRADRNVHVVAGTEDLIGASTDQAIAVGVGDRIGPGRTSVAHALAELDQHLRDALVSYHTCRGTDQACLRCRAVGLECEDAIVAITQ